MAQAVTPDFLLTVPPGWSVVGKRTLRQVTPDYVPNLVLEGFEWFDVRGLGLGGTNRTIDALVTGRFRQQFQALGSDLYAYAVIRKTEFNWNVLGLQLARVDRYRLILCHSAAWIAGLLVLLGIALAAVILFQYVTTGQSPLADALKKMWNDLVKAAAAPVTGAFDQQLVIVLLLVGGTGLLIAGAGKKLDVPPPKPAHVNLGVKSKHATAGIRT